MFSLQVVQKPGFSYSQNILDVISKNIYKHIKITQNWVINIAFIDKESIQNLNKNYRNKDSTTDVLSFHYHEVFSQLSDNDLAWEIVLCESIVISQGSEYKLWTEHEFYKLIIHSVLHILWFDHETDQEYEQMKKWEEIVWNEIFGDKTKFNN